MISSPADSCLCFGPFTLQPRRQLLLDAGQPVRLGSRAFELLVALLERPGEVLGRDELERRIWPRSVVEATSLRVHASRLRRALRDGEDGARYIVNVPGRGYVFVGDVTVRTGLRSPSSGHRVPEAAPGPSGAGSTRVPLIS